MAQHSLYPGGQHTLAFYTKRGMPVGRLVLREFERMVKSQLRQGQLSACKD